MTSLFRHFLPTLILCAAVTGATAQSTVFVVRHADRGPEEPDAALTPLGLHQADELAALLADTGIRHIYTSELTRTRQTAAPTAKHADVRPVIVAQKDFPGLIKHIQATLPDGGATLVVGHRSTVPRIVQALGGGEIPPLAFDEFTRLIVLTIPPAGPVTTVTLRYGLGPLPEHR